MNFFPWYDSQNWPFFLYDCQNWTFFNITQGNEFFFFKYDSKNCFFKKNNSKNWMFFQYLTKNWTLFVRIWRKELNPFFFEYDAKNWIFLKKSKNWTSSFQEYDSKNWTLCQKKKTQRIELFWNDSQNWTSFYEPLLNVTQRVEVFLQYDSKSSTFLVFQYDSKGWTPFHWIWLKELNLLLMRRKELNPFLICLKETNFYFSDMNDSKNYFLTKNTQWIELFKMWLKELNIWTVCQKKDPENGTLWKWLFEMTHRIEPFFEPFQDDSKSWSLFSIWPKELNPLFFSKCLKELNLFFSKCSKNWTSLSFELLFYMTQRIELFFFSNVTQRIEPLLEYDSKNWIFVRYIRLKVKESNLFFLIRINESNTFFFCMWLMFSNDLKNWFSFFEKFLEELIFHMTLRMVPDAKTWNLCFWNLIQRIGFFWWLADLKLFFQKLWRKEFFLKKMTQRIEPFFLYDSKNWTLFVWLKELNPFCMTQRIEPFFVWRKELNPFALNMTQRIEPFFFICRKELSFFAKFWLELSHFFLNRTHRIELFLNDLQNWTSSFFTNMIRRIERCVKKRDSKNRHLLFRKMTQRIELFVND